MAKLLLPLHCYDEAGRVRPPAFFWWCNLFLARSLFILVVSLTMRENGDFLLSFFYPLTEQFMFATAIGVGPFLVVVIASFREKWWDSRWVWLAKLIKPVMLLALLIDIGHQISVADQQRWSFNWSIALFILVDAMCIYWLWTSEHMKLMIRDWQN